ncbi:unnamed protein product [Adineta steineri]|uniref:Uncharacterized protein n=1 Tax=Adineta steineri TaxID=433720 RepID=A0A819UXP2_9BILA|nr:unnamed protein product [Adineta steineri]CAF4102330.1 unnamed protein product [Adineta steineri]
MRVKGVSVRYACKNWKGTTARTHIAFFYRVYNHAQEVERLIYCGLNELKGRLLNGNIVVTRLFLKKDYGVSKLGAHKHPLATVATTTITSTASFSYPDHHSTDDEDSVHTNSQ